MTFALLEIDEAGIRPIRPVPRDGQGIFAKYRGEAAQPTAIEYDAEERAMIAARLRRYSCRDRMCGAGDCVTCRGEKAAVDHALGL